MKHLASLLLLFLVPVCAQKHPLETLMDAARQQSPALKELLPASIHALKERGGAAVWGHARSGAVVAGLGGLQGPSAAHGGGRGGDGIGPVDDGA